MCGAGGWGPLAAGLPPPHCGPFPVLRAGVSPGPPSPPCLCFAVIRAKVVSGQEVDSGNDIYGNPIKRIQYEIKQIKVRGTVRGAPLGRASDGREDGGVPQNSGGSAGQSFGRSGGRRGPLELGDPAEVSRHL